MGVSKGGKEMISLPGLQEGYKVNWKVSQARDQQKRKSQGPGG